MNNVVKIAPTPEVGPPLDKAAFRQALGTFATGVTIVTARAPDGSMVGVTANSFNSVSLDPPLVLWSLSRKSGSFRAFTSATHWAVHILSHDQDALSHRFARPVAGSEKFEGVAYEHGEGGAPLLSGCSSRMQCRAVHVYDGGDHVILVGEVIRFDRCDSPPLVFHNGRYAIAASTCPRTPPPDGEDPRNVSEQSSLGYLLSSAALHYNARFYEQSRQLNLTETEQLIISALDAREPRTYDELIALINYTGRAAGTEVINDLAARGLIRIADDGCTPEREDDAHILLSDQGRAVAEKIRTEIERLETAICQQISPTDTVALRNLLSRFIRVYTPLMPYRWF